MLFLGVLLYLQLLLVEIMSRYKSGMACFFAIQGEKMNIKKPGYEQRFGFEVKKFNLVLRFCSEIIVLGV